MTSISRKPHTIEPPVAMEASGGTDFTFAPQDTGASDRVDAAQRIAAERKPSFTDTLFAAMEQSAPTINVLNQLGGEHLVPDPNFHATPEYVQDLSQKFNVPLEYLKDLQWATSDQHAHKIAWDVQRELENKQTLAAAGWQGTALSMFATVADPITLGSTFTPAGIAGWAEKGGALRAAVKGGLLAGGQNAAVEGLLAGMQHTSDPHDVIDAGLTGFMLGVGPGALAGHITNRAANVRAATMLQSLKDSGVDLSQFGEVELKNAVGGAMPAASVGAAAAEGAEIAGVQSTAFLKLRSTMANIGLGDPFAKITAWGEHWAGLASRLIDDPVGNKTLTLADGTKVKPAAGINAAEWASMEMKRYESSADSALHDAWTAYAQRNQINWFKATQDVQRSFFEDVTRALRGDMDVISRNQEAAQAAQHIAALNKDVLERMKKLGVEGADAVDPNQFYVMRKYDFDKIRILSGDKHYKGAMHSLITEAIQRAQPTLEADRAAVIGKNFVKRLRELPTDKSNLGFLSDAGFEKFAASLRQGGVFSEQEIDDILGHVFNDSVRKPTDAGNTPRLKKRMFLDESHKVTFKDDKGIEHTLGFQDLLVNDIRLLNRSYFKQTTGLMGLAKVGVYGRGDIEAMLKEAVDLDNEAGVVSEAVNQRRDYVERIVRGITGVPMYEGFGSKAEKTLRVLKNFNFVNNMAQGAMAQVAEIGQLVSMKMSMALRSQVPDFDHVLNLARDGRMPKELARDLEAMGAVASELDLRKPVPAYLQGDSIDRFLTRADNRMAQAANAVGRASGMAALNDFERYTMAQLYSNRLLRLAAGLEKMDDAMARRLATNGIEGAELERFFEKVREHVEVDPATKQVVGVDYEAWERASPRTYDQFRLAVHREAYRSIQETSLGATPMWMHSSLGRILGQFRSFVLNAWTKQTLYGLNHADPQTFMQFAFTTMFGGLSYVAQTSLNYASDQKALDEKLSMDNVALAAFNRAGWSSLLPGAVDSVAGLATGNKFFAHARTTNLSSDWVTGIPTVALLDKIWGAAGAGFGSVLPDSMLSQPHVWTQKEVGQVLGLLPRYYGVSTFINDVKQDFPKHNPFAAQ
jgi:hypothetical protein